MSAFEDDWTLACQDLNAEFGEEVLVRARVESEKLGFQLDASRGERSVIGVFTLHGASDRLGGTRQGTELQGMSSLAVAPATVWFSADQLAAIGFAPRQGDMIVLSGRGGRPAYAIAKRDPSDLDDATFPLTRER